MISLCPHPAADPLSVRELRNVAQMVANFNGTCFSYILQAMQIERNGTIEVPFDLSHDLCLREELLQTMYADITHMHIYAVLHHLTEKGPYTARFFTGWKHTPLSWELSVTYDGTSFEVRVASRKFDDADYHLVEIPHTTCSLKCFEIEDDHLLPLLDHMKHLDFMRLLDIEGTPYVDSPPMIYDVPDDMQYNIIPGISLHTPILSDEDFKCAIQYYLSWECSKVVLYRIIDGEQCMEVVCDTGNISTQDLRESMFTYTEVVLSHMRKYMNCALRIYIGYNMEDMFAVEFSMPQENCVYNEYVVRYLTSPKLSAMTESEITEHFHTYIEDYLRYECEMRDRLHQSIKNSMMKNVF